ncbi:hypothetical protein NTGM5_240027 [Candidatus Nitrotoga sp. M5]|nr:hypothetical protein NTGM5_240027 [Candidatus Nitrotoga sp. M5]
MTTCHVTESMSFNLYGFASQLLSSKLAVSLSQLYEYLKLIAVCSEVII